MKDYDSIYDDITAQWDELLQTIRWEIVDLDKVKHLIYDTFYYIKSDFKGDSIPREKLELHKYICQVSQALSTEYAVGIRQSESHMLHACAMGLCFLIEDGFLGYSGNSLLIGLNDAVSGFYIPEADMTTYESFNEAFDKSVDEWKEYYEEDE